MSIRMHDKWYKELTMRIPQMTTGKIFYVDDISGSDSNSGRYQFAPKLTIQSAVDASVDARGDIIFIGPGVYNENVLIKDKSRLSLIGVPIASKETRIRASAGTTKYPFTPVGEAAVLGCCIVVLSTCVQIANLCLDASGHYVGIYVGDGTRISSSYNEDTNGVWIHDNWFKYGDWGITLDGCSEDHKIEKNMIYRQQYGGIYIAPGSNRTVQRVYITENTIFAGDTGCYGVYLYNSASVRTCHIARNTFMDGVDASANAKAFTKPILSQGAGLHTIVGNWFACATEPQAVATDYSAGNFFGTTSVTTTVPCVDET